MAYDLFSGFYNQDDEDEKAQATTGAGMSGMGAAAGGPGTPVPAASAVPAQSPGKFVNFDRYLSANKTGAQNMATGLVKDATQKANTGMDAVSALESRHNAGIADAKQNKDGNGPQNFGQNSLVEAPDYQNASDLVRQGTQAVGQLNTQGGVQTALQEKNSRAGNYTGGMSRFDTALTNSVGRRQFGDLKRQFAGLDGRLGQATEASAKASADHNAWAEGERGRIAEEKRLAQQTLDDADTARKTAEAEEDEIFNAAYLNNAYQTGDDEWLKRVLERDFGPGAWEKFLRARARRQGQGGQLVNSMYTNPGGTTPSAPSPYSYNSGVSG